MFVYLAIHNAQQFVNGRLAQQPIKFNRTQIKRINKQLQNGRAKNGEELKMEIRKRQVLVSSNFGKSCQYYDVDSQLMLEYDVKQK